MAKAFEAVGSTQAQAELCLNLMKHIIHTDALGYKRRVLVKDEDGASEASYGIPAGPPDMRQIDWDSVAREINNILVDMEIFTWQDAQRNRHWFDAAASTVKRALITNFRQQDNQSKE
jgi:hypothetical protein